ncbi:MAG: hypothetical protein KIS68_10730 [Bauldia sp.]|nr:hypothetical protein [Bauldia sp.]
MKRRLAPACLLLIGIATPQALAADSVYTALKLESCSQRPTDPREELPWSLWDCAGYGGIAVLVGESDLRFTISYGVDGPADTGGGQTLAPFNSIGETLEWRLDDAGQPFATIIRYFVDTGEPGAEGQVLVVTKLGTTSCHAAYVDALANEDANTIARAAADLIAPSFRCDIDTPLWVSTTGTAF